MKSIFISIASFRDPDCVNTIGNLHDMANNPDRLSLGVCNQIIRGQDNDCILHANIAPGLRIEEVDASQSRGACWARSRIQALWQGEDFYFQIDSHMRFVRGWDDLLIDMLNDCPAQKAVLSTYPLTFTPPQTYGKPEIVRLTPKWFDENGILTCYSSKTNINNAPSSPQENYFIAAGLLFSPSAIIKEIPYDPNLYHVGEEISLAVRLWTHGWNIYTPNKVIAYHDYGKREDRSKHWKNDKNWLELDASSKARVRRLFGIEPLPQTSVNTPNLASHALGTERTLPEYEVKAGVQFRLRMIGNTLSTPAQLTAKSTEQQATRRKHFIELHNTERNHLSQPSCNSEDIEIALASWLEYITKQFGIKTACNLGCGQDLSLHGYIQGLEKYVGYDLVPDIIEQNRASSSQFHNFEYHESEILDISTDQNFDLIICTQVLEYLPLDAAVMVLSEIASRMGKYVALTYCPNGQNRWVHYGERYDLRAELPPFSMPTPFETAQLSPNMYVGLWELGKLTHLASTSRQI